MWWMRSRADNPCRLDGCELPASLLRSFTGGACRGERRSSAVRGARSCRAGSGASRSRRTVVSAGRVVEAAAAEEEIVPRRHGQRCVGVTGRRRLSRAGWSPKGSCATGPWCWRARFRLPGIGVRARRMPWKAQLPAVSVDGGRRCHWRWRRRALEEDQSTGGPGAGRAWCRRMAACVARGGAPRSSVRVEKKLPDETQGSGPMCGRAWRRAAAFRTRGGTAGGLEMRGQRLDGGRGGYCVKGERLHRDARWRTMGRGSTRELSREHGERSSRRPPNKSLKLTGKRAWRWLFAALFAARKAAVVASIEGLAKTDGPAA